MIQESKSQYTTSSQEEKINFFTLGSSIFIFFSFPLVKSLNPLNLDSKNVSLSLDQVPTHVITSSNMSKLCTVLKYKTEWNRVCLE